MRRGKALLAALVLAAVAVVGSPGGPAGPAAAAPGQQADPTGEFTGVTPARILDTRSGLGRGGFAAPLGGGETLPVVVTGRGGVPATGVQAVVMNVTAVAPTAAGYVTVWPAGQPRPEISNLNFPQWHTVPNLVTVAVGPGGAVNLYNPAGSTHVLFDVVGFYADGAGQAGSRYAPTTLPTRVLDTRDGTGGVPAAPIGSGETLSFDTTGLDDLPGSGVTGVAINVTVTAATGGGYLTVHPGDVAPPDASNLNFLPGQTVANLVTVRVPPSGVVDFTNAYGHTHVIADLVGYYTEPGTRTSGRFVALSPYRALDTRIPPALPLFGEFMYSLPVGGVGPVPAAGAFAVVANTTITRPSVPGWLTVFPKIVCMPPDVSTLNFVGDQTVANLTITYLTPLSVCSDDRTERPMQFQIPRGRADLLVDVFGYFTSGAV